MRYLVATLLLIFSLNTWAQHAGQKAVSSPEPGKQVREEFLRKDKTGQAMPSIEVSRNKDVCVIPQ